MTNNQVDVSATMCLICLWIHYFFLVWFLLYFSWKKNSIVFFKFHSTWHNAPNMILEWWIINKAYFSARIPVMQTSSSALMLRTKNVQQRVTSENVCGKSADITVQLYCTVWKRKVYYRNTDISAKERWFYF